MIAAESRGAWRELEARLRPYVARRVGSPSDVDDVLQEVFVRLHRGVSGLNDGERFGPWTYRIAQNAIADHLRARARHPLAEPEAEAVAEPGDAEEERLEAELSACVVLFVARLPSPYREAVTLTQLQGMTHKDAADLLGISLTAMKSRVQRGRDRIRQMFEECCVVSLDARGRVTNCQARPLDEVPDDMRAAAESWAERHG